MEFFYPSSRTVRINVFVIDFVDPVGVAVIVTVNGVVGLAS